jgi:hypothetical protein
MPPIEGGFPKKVCPALPAEAEEGALKHESSLIGSSSCFGLTAPPV